MSITPDVDFDLLAAHTDGGTGADIKAMCTEAGMFAIREDRDVVTSHDFDLAVEKVHGQNLSKSKSPEGMYA
jgi:proteasome regulatory subunit